MPVYSTPGCKHCLGNKKYQANVRGDEGWPRINRTGKWGAAETASRLRSTLSYEARICKMNRSPTDLDQGPRTTSQKTLPGAWDPSSKHSFTVCSLVLPTCDATELNKPENFLLHHRSSTAPGSWFYSLGVTNGEHSSWLQCFSPGGILSEHSSCFLASVRLCLGIKPSQTLCFRIEFLFTCPWISSCKRLHLQGNLPHPTLSRNQMWTVRSQRKREWVVFVLENNKSQNYGAWKTQSRVLKLF